MQILVPLDGSPFSEQALECASEIAQRARARLHLVRVQAEPVIATAEIAPTYDRRLNAELWRAASEYVAAQAATVSSTFGVPTRSVVLNGPIAQAIANYVAKANINLVVMASHGRTGFGRALLGSVADALTRILAVPVLLLRPHKGGDGPEVQPFRSNRILIALDGSEFAEQIIEPAVELGWLTGARYTLLQVIPPPIAETYPTAVAAQIDDHELKHIREQAKEYLEGVANRLRAVGLRVDTVVSAHAQTTAGIIQESIACEADVIAMATHGRSGWKRLALGSVAQQVLHAAHLPLLVLKGATTETQENRLEATSAAG